MATVTPSPVIERLDAIRVWPYHRRVLIALGAAYFFAFYDVVNIGDALPEIARQFDVSTKTSGYAVSIGLLGYVVGSLSDSVVADRLGRRPALIVSVVFIVIGSLITAFSASFDMLMVGRFISGMGIGAEIASAAAYLNGISPTRLRGKAGSKAVLWGYVGIAVTPFVALALVPTFTDGWRVMFLIAAVGGIAVLPFRRKLPESPRWLVMEGREDEALALVEEAESFAATQGPAPPQPELKPATARRPFWTAALLFLAIWLIYYVANYGWLTLAPTLLTDKGFSLSTSLTFLCISGIGFVVGAWASVRFSERFERKFTICVGLVVFSVSLAVIGLAPVGAVITIFGFIVSATIGFAVPLMYVFTAEQFSTQTRARGVAMGDGVGHIGGAAAPLIILPAAAAGFFWGMAVMALAGLISAVLVLFGQRMTGRAQ
ncbi:MAG: MFS transporter [Solirubrobacterales bacterium]